MLFHQYVMAIANAVRDEDGQRLAALVRISGQEAVNLLRDLRDSRRTSLARFSSSIVDPWGEIAIAHVQVLVNIEDKNFVESYREQAALLNLFLRFFVTKSGWTLPVLYTVLRDLRELSDKSDQMEKSQTGKAVTKWREDAARICNKAFSSCVTDRSSAPEDSRKWGIYYTVGLVLKSYFKVQRTSLSRNVIRALKANNDIPPLTEYPRAHQVTYKYYLGMLSFLNEDYEQAEQELTQAFYLCHCQAQSNLERILTYLLPLRLLRGHLPSDELSFRFPALKALCDPFINAIRKGDLKQFDDALNETATQKRLLDLGLYLVFEKAREICIRCLFRRMWISGTSKGTRIPIAMFHASLRVSGQDIPVEEAECIVANMIFKGFMRGYVSHEKQMVVLAQTNSFPKLSTRANPFAY
ncbi:hypothetical protein SISNIDRAFT_477193 [Sistotremastrum niveocremeum HHB9708]|uniref:PCI domain-containing protein n=1 Tax=Sistotremastrum niveocremeum HHB9708 TaxID=1314777 RepID=A0A164ZK07_9AGAM|nr:hypothetical protein SISNIDRAFT_477193 [Sistotremastrum niveocremeum HHB9708]